MASKFGLDYLATSWGGTDVALTSRDGRVRLANFVESSFLFLKKKPNAYRLQKLAISAEFRENSIRTGLNKLESVLFATNFLLKWFIAAQNHKLFMFQPFPKKILFLGRHTYTYILTYTRYSWFCIYLGTGCYCS